VGREADGNKSALNNCLTPVLIPRRHFDHTQAKAVVPRA
jgi:hypothetical protein